MNEEQIQRLKKTLSIPTKTWEEERLITHILESTRGLYDMIDVDDIGNIYITKGKSDNYPCFVAHTDSVHSIVEMDVKTEMLPNTQGELKESFKAYRSDNGQPTGIGGDDKAGVFICLELLREVDVCKIFLPVAEETGCHGSSQADPEFFKDVAYSIQFDSTENDTMSRTLMGVPLFEKDGEFINKVSHLINEHGLTNWHAHPYTDTMVLKQHFDFSCLNLAAGYYNYHTVNEYVIIEDVYNTLELTKKIVSVLGSEKYTFVNKVKGSTFLFD
tara:strand:- start:998 stop:1816 length:819 start_codon:yes stop_codon:yes gene_type:complete